MIILFLEVFNLLPYAHIFNLQLIMFYFILQFIKHIKVHNKGEDN